MVPQEFLASVSLDDLKMMQRVFSQVRSEFGYPPKSWKAQALTNDLIRAFKGGKVQETELLDKVRAMRRESQLARESRSAVPPSGSASAKVT